MPHGIDLYAAFIGAMAAGLTPSMPPPPQVRRERAAWARAQAQVIARARPLAIAGGAAELHVLESGTTRVAVLGPEPFRPPAEGFRPVLGAWTWLLSTLEAQGDEAALAKARAAAALAPVDIPTPAA